MSTQLDRIEQMLRALCSHLGVQDAEPAGNGHSEPAAAGDGRRYSGVVARFEHGWGFIECEAMNRSYFVHYSDIEGTGIRSLDPGEAVTFETAPGKDGRPKAVLVRRQPGGQSASHRPAGRGSRFEAFPRAAGPHGNGERAPEELQPPEGSGFPDTEPEAASE